MNLLTILLSMSSFAQAGQYEKCEIVHGKVTSCMDGWYTGKAVVFHNNQYEMCEIVHGKVTSCMDGWYTGKAVVYK